MTPKLSICIPSYNNAPYLPELIDSILHQSFEDFELLISDDCSTDHSVEIIRNYRDPRIKLYQNKENVGIVVNMNRCLLSAKGDYMTIIGSDDVLMVDSLKTRMDFLQANTHLGFVCSNIVKIDGEGKTIGGLWSHAPKQNTVFDAKTCFRRLMFEGNFICHSTVIVHKECHERFGYFDARFPSCQDYDMWFRLSLHYDLGYLAQPLVKYRWHTQNITQQYRGKNNLKGKEQNNLARSVALHLYHKQKDLNYFTAEELRLLYKNLMLLYFWMNQFKSFRKLFLESLKHGYLNLSTCAYYVLSFLPLKILNYLRSLKPQTDLL